MINTKQQTIEVDPNNLPADIMHTHKCTIPNKCTFSWGAATYGHECGAPATKVAVKKSEYLIGMGWTTVTGLYFAGRCDACAKIKGGENSGNLRIEELNPARHINVWGKR